MNLKQRLIVAVCILGLVELAAVIAAPALAQEEGERDPLESGLVEETGQRLIQLDVSFSSKKRAGGAPFPELTREDFHLVISGRPVQIEFADRICNITLEESLTAVADEPEPEPAPATRPRQASYVFYVEHKLLTLMGQNIALEMLERLIPELVSNGNRGMLVSSGTRVIDSDFTEDPEELLSLVGEIRKDTGQWTEYAYAQEEERRYQEIFQQSSTVASKNTARTHQLDEMRITSSRLHRLSALIGGMADLDQPKAVFYFADMARRRPGEHFLKLFTTGTDRILGGGSELTTLNHSFAFDDVLEKANAQGVRLYTIQAQGMQPSDTMPSLRQKLPPTSRIKNAEDTMRSFAAETGGEMFFGGADSATIGKVLRTIEEDYGCFYLLSFRPDDLPEDRLLRVALSLNDTEAGQTAAKAFESSSRGQLVVQSAKKREQSLLLAAHLTSGTVESDPGRGVVIPLAYDGGVYLALVQFVVRGSELAARLTGDSLWDMGMTHVFGPEVQGKVASRISVNDPSAPVVLETLWKFEPGASEIVSVGREHRLGQLATSQIETDWPDPDKAGATVSLIAAVQQQAGVFLRKNGEEENIRYNGSLGVGSGFVNVDQPTYLIELVCRGRRVKQDLWVRRRLSGETSAEFQLLHWEFDGQRCIQVRDFVGQGQMSWGEFKYEVEVFDNEGLEGSPLASATRDLAALSDEPLEVPEIRAMDDISDPGSD